MKTFKSLLATLVVVFFSQLLYAQQDYTGLYMTYNDFLQKKLSYPVECGSKNGKLRLNELFGSSKGFVIQNGEKHEFDKKRVYGYRTCANKNYRFYNNSSYEILDTAGFYIYYQYRLEQKVKGKGAIKTDEYFFSRHAGDPILALTADNLKKAFPGNHMFHHELDAQFRSDKDLMAYDSYAKNYKVKCLYNDSLK